MKQKAISLYNSGYSSTEASEVLDVSPTSVLTWSRRYGQSSHRVFDLPPKLRLPREAQLAIKQFEDELKYLQDLLVHCEYNDEAYPDKVSRD